MGHLLRRKIYLNPTGKRYIIYSMIVIFGGEKMFKRRFKAQKVHKQIFRRLVHGIDRHKPYKILDAGSGRTSLSLILETYPMSHIDAVVYPGDLRKINSIKESVPMGRYRLIEQDLCLGQIAQQYEIVVAHLLLGEAAKFGSSFTLLLDTVLLLHAEKLVIIDFLEDPDVEFDLILQHAQAYGYTVKCDHTIKGSEPFHCKRFVGWHYRGFLLETEK